MGARTWGFIFAGALVTVLLLSTWEEILHSLQDVVKHMKKLYEVFQQARAEGGGSMVPDVPIADAKMKSRVEALLRSLRLDKIWLPASTVVALVAGVKLAIDVWEDDDSKAAVAAHPESKKARNKLQTTQHSNIFALLVVETLAYVSSGPNLLSLIIGIVQAVAAGKFAMIAVNIFTFSQQLYQALAQHKNCAKNDESRNSVPVRVSGSGQVRADQVKLNDVLELYFCDQTPAVVEVLSVEQLGPDSSSGPLYGYAYDREGSGEDVSKPFQKSDKLQPFLELTRPYTRVTAKVVGLVKSERGIQVQPPKFLDTPLLATNVFAMLVVFILAFSVAATATIERLGALEQQGGVTASTLTQEFLMHFAAGAVAEHSIIPSMRMTLIYTLFLLTLNAGFWQTTVQQYSAMDDVQRLNCATFDKTGTLTDHTVLHVHQWYPYKERLLSDTAEQLGWSEDELLLALTVANSESTVLPQDELESMQQRHTERPPTSGLPGSETDGVWGTSPEECEMLRWWLGNGFALESNPLRDEYCRAAARPAPIRKQDSKVRFEEPKESSFVGDAAQQQELATMKKRASLADVKETGILSFHAKVGDSAPSEGWGGALGTPRGGKESRKLRVMMRNQYKFQVGKTASIEVVGKDGKPIRLEVRQTGLSFLCDEDTADPDAVKYMKRIAKEDPRRAMGIAFRDPEADEEGWTLAGIYTFQNPVRPGVVRTMQFLRQRGISVGMLTGDAQEAAEAIARETGICPQEQHIAHLEESNDGGLALAMPCLDEEDEEKAADASPSGDGSRSMTMFGGGSQKLGRSRASTMMNTSMIQNATRTFGRQKSMTVRKSMFFAPPVDDMDQDFDGTSPGQLKREALVQVLNDQQTAMTIAVEGKLLLKWCESTDPQIQADLGRFLTHPKLNRVMFRASEIVKREVTLVARKTSMVMHVGDAANDAQGIRVSSVGACLKHGAEVSRVHAKLLIKTPEDLIDVMAPNGFADMVLVGGQRLLFDLLSLGGLSAGVVIVGLNAMQYKLLEDKATGRRIPIFVDFWAPTHWIIFSQFYTLTAIANATSECRYEKKLLPSTMALTGCLLMSAAVTGGALIGWIIKNWSNAESYGFAAVHVLFLVMLFKHSWHCYARHVAHYAGSASEQKVVVGFGPQHRSTHAQNTVAKGLSVLDSVTFRVVLYWVFCVLTFTFDEAPKTQVHAEL